MTTRAAWKAPTSQAEAFARAAGRKAYNARRRVAADSTARAIVARLQQLGPVVGAQRRVSKEQGVSASTVSRALLRVSALSSAALSIENSRSGVTTSKRASLQMDEVRTLRPKSEREAIRAFVRSRLGITVAPAHPRRLTKAQKAERNTQLLASVLARWATDTRTEAEQMADAHMLPPDPVQQHVEALEMLAEQRRRQREMDLDTRALLADLRADP